MTDASHPANLTNATSFFTGAVLTKESTDGLYYDTNSSDEYSVVPYGAHIFVGIFMIPVTILAILGNSVVVYLFIKFRSLRTPGNLLLINLSVSDLLMAFTGFPLFIIASFQGRWTFGQIGCDFYGSTGATFGLMSINSMAAIALDRHLVINRGKRLNFRQVMYIITVVWLYSLLWAIPPLVGWSDYKLEGFLTTCSYDYLTKGTSDRYFLVAVFIGDYVLPFLVICYCYSWIFLKFKYHQHEFKTILKGRSLSKSSSESSLESLKKRSRRFYNGQKLTSCKHINKGKVIKKTIWTKTEYRIAKTVFLVVIVYIMSWTPYALVALIGQYGNQDIITPLIAMVPIIIAKMSTLYNPFIYTISHPRFKAALRKVFSFCNSNNETPYIAKFHKIPRLARKSSVKNKVNNHYRPSGKHSNSVDDALLSTEHVIEERSSCMSDAFFHVSMVTSASSQQVKDIQVSVNDIMKWIRYSTPDNSDQRCCTCIRTFDS